LEIGKDEKKEHALVARKAAQKEIQLAVATAEK